MRTVVAARAAASAGAAHVVAARVMTWRRPRPVGAKARDDMRSETSIGTNLAVSRKKQEGFEEDYKNGSDKNRSEFSAALLSA